MLTRHRFVRSAERGGAIGPPSRGGTGAPRAAQCRAGTAACVRHVYAWAMRTWRPPMPAPRAPADRRTLGEEIVAVLALSLFASAVYAVLSLVEAPLRGVTVAAANQDPRILRQILAVVFGLAPVFLVWHLTRRTGEYEASSTMRPITLASARSSVRPPGR